MAKADGAFLTIGELAAELGVPQHVLRYWETRFPALKPLQRAGNRRYYRAEDVALARRIHQLLNADGYTVRGVQQLLASEPAGSPATVTAAAAPAPDPPTRADLTGLRALRASLLEALARDDLAGAPYS